MHNATHLSCIEYFIFFQAWLKSLGVAGATHGLTKDVLKCMSQNAFEAVVNILERYTGLSKDPIPQVRSICIYICVYETQTLQT